MQEINYELKKTDDEGKPMPFQGMVRLKMPRPKDRLKMLREMKITVKRDEDGKPVVDLKDDGGLDMADRMLDLVAAHVVSISIEHVGAKKAFTKLEDLEIYQEFNTLAAEISRVVLNGVQLGNG